VPHFSLVIIGSGSGNSLVPEDGAQGPVALIESGAFGGTCINRGCIPSKILIQTVQVAAQVRHASEFGIEAKLTGVDWPAIRDRTFTRTDGHSAAGRRGRAESGAVTLIEGRAHNLAFPDDLRSYPHDWVPSAVFTAPQIATVGARAQDLSHERPYVEAIQEYADVAYGWALQDSVGFCKLYADPATGTLLGAHIMGEQASLLIQPLIQAAATGQRLAHMARGQYWIHPAARFVQGIGGALLTPGSLAIIDAVFHPDDRTRAIGAWAGLGAVAGAIGPTVGGYLTDAVSWRAVFLINLPLGVFVVVAAVLHVPETRDPTRAGGLDLRGAALATLAIAGVCFALIEASGGLTPAVIAASAVGLAATAAFVAVERRARHPMLPLELFRSRQFASANLLALVTYAALGGVIFLFVAFLQITLGYTALQAGAATLPITLLLLTLSTPSGAIAQRIGPRIPLTIGAVLTGAGLLLMAQIHPGDRYLPAVLLPLIVFGVGLAALITPITATVLASVDSRHSGIASAVNNALSRLGQMIAVAALPLAAGLSGSAFEDPARMAAGFPVAMTVAAGASFAAALLAWTTISNDVLSRSGTDTQQVPKELPPSLKRHCPVAGTPLAASLNTPPSSRPPTALTRP
jgi:MFS family permease